MRKEDCDRLRRWVGLSSCYLNFDPISNPGDCAIVEEKLLGDDYSITITQISHQLYSCTIAKYGPDSIDPGIRAEGPTRRTALAMCALAVCP